MAVNLNYDKNLTEDFEIPVLYKGKEWKFTARLIQSRYAYKIEMDMGDVHVNFERDDEGSWRAMLSEKDMEKHHTIDGGLLQVISLSIDKILS